MTILIALHLRSFKEQTLEVEILIYWHIVHRKLSGDLQEFQAEIKSISVTCQVKRYIL